MSSRDKFFIDIAVNGLNKTIFWNSAIAQAGMTKN